MLPFDTFSPIPPPPDARPRADENAGICVEGFNQARCSLHVLCQNGDVVCLIFKNAMRLWSPDGWLEERLDHNKLSTASKLLVLRLNREKVR